MISTQKITKAEASYEVAKTILESYCTKKGYRIRKYSNSIYIPFEGEKSDQNCVFIITDPCIRGYPDFFVTIYRLEHCFDDRDYFTEQIIKAIEIIRTQRASIVLY